MDREALIYDWNTVGGLAKPSQEILFDDESLRDGLQSPSVTNPSIDDKIRILHLMHEIGVDWTDIGLPGGGPSARKAAEKADARVQIDVPGHRDRGPGVNNRHAAS